GTSVLSPIIPFLFVVVPAYVISQKSTDQIYENHPALYIMAFGMITAKVTNRLVVAHMTKSEMEYLDWGLIGPLCLFLNQYFNSFLPEYYVLHDSKNGTHSLTNNNNLQHQQQSSQQQTINRKQTRASNRKQNSSTLLQ
uniref:Uncharacterized protein n=1 Tax=Anopheles maculatus TaxID=74869 RepID=A0A182T937_9DIPT